MSLFAGVELVGRPCLENVRKLDLSVLPIIRKMHSRGMAVNREYFADLSLDIEHQMEDLRKDVMSYIPQSAIDEFVHTTFNIDSPEQISSALFKHLKIGYDRDLKLTKSGTRISSGKKQLEELKNDHPIIPPILQYRERAKLLNTYTRKIPKIAAYDRATDTWRVHTGFGVTATSTGRLNSSGSINMQNIPFRTDLGKRVRNGFYATPGYKLVSTDFSQIELRVLAHIAHEREMIRIFQSDGDIHIDTCIRANSLTQEQWDAMYVIKNGERVLSKEQKDMRLPAKSCNFLACIAEGQRVLTEKRGLVPIQDIKCHDRVWDGIEFVSHSGVIFKGYREVVTYDGINATSDHEIWVEDGRKMELSEAMAQGLKLAATDSSPRGFLERDTSEKAAQPVQEKVRVYDILNAGPRRRFTVEGKLVSNCYQGTGLGLQQTLAVAGVRQPLDWCTNFIENIWHSLYPDVRPFMETQARNMMRYGYVWCLFGRIRLMPHARSVMRNIQSDGVRECGNMKDQGTSAGIMKLAMAEVDYVNEEYLKEGIDIHPLLSIHDQLVQEVPEGHEEDYAEHVKSIFEASCPLLVPLKAEYDISDTWLH